MSLSIHTSSIYSLDLDGRFCLVFRRSSSNVSSSNVEAQNEHKLLELRTVCLIPHIKEDFPFKRHFNYQSLILEKIFDHQGSDANVNLFLEKN